MIDLKDLLHALDRQSGSKIELMSGRRPRIVKGAELRNLADEILTDDEVIELCRQAGGGRRLDDLSERPLVWSHPTSNGPVAVTAMTKGREVAATLTRAEGDAALRDAATRRGIKPVRKTARDLEAVGSRSKPPQAAVRQATARPPASGRPTATARRVTPPAPRAAAGTTSPRRTSHAPTKPAKHEPPPRDLEVDFGDSRQGLAHKPAAPKSVPPSRPEAAPAVRPAVSIEGLGRQAKKDELLSELLREAVKKRASDLHLTSNAPPFVRTLEGVVVLPGRRELSRAEIERLLHALLPESLLSEMSSKGGASFAVSVGSSHRLRVNASVTLTGPKLSIRILPSSPPTFEELGLPPELQQATRHHQGLVVITGPTGQGKTSTLAALIDRINDERALHIVMVEDPSEILIPSKRSVVSQREVGAHAKSFERALIGALRQDPDVIVVGELRDVTTVRMALSASETGHLVLGTMNTPSARSAIDRLIDLFPPADQPQVRATLAGGLRLVACQRLLARADGSGRVAACEILPGSTALWSLIRDDKTFQIGSLMQRGRGAGILRLNDSLSDLLKSGAITREAALAASDDPHELSAQLDVPRGGRPEHSADRSPAENVAAYLAAAEGAGAAPQPEAPTDMLGSLLNKAGALFGRKGGG